MGPCPDTAEARRGPAGVCGQPLPPQVKVPQPHRPNAVAHNAGGRLSGQPELGSERAGACRPACTLGAEGVRRRALTSSLDDKRALLAGRAAAEEGEGGRCSA